MGDHGPALRVFWETSQQTLYRTSAFLLCPGNTEEENALPFHAFISESSTFVASTTVSPFTNTAAVSSEPHSATCHPDQMSGGRCKSQVSECGSSLFRPGAPQDPTLRSRRSAAGPWKSQESEPLRDSLAPAEKGPREQAQSWVAGGIFTPAASVISTHPDSLPCIV